MRLNFRQTLLDIFFPKICQHCGDPFQEGLSNILCRRCFDSIEPYEEPVCEHCGASLPWEAFEGAVTRRCGDCGEDRYYLDQVRSYGDYGGALRIAHHAFKFEGMESFQEDIAGKMKGLGTDSLWRDAGALVPVPQSPERERERGYNPAALLARRISGETHCPYLPVLKKIRSTLPQMSLTREERLRNPKNAYQVAAGVALPEKVILVDDVFTTGSTLEECARVLKKAGAVWVGALVFGRTPRY